MAKKISIGDAVTAFTSKLEQVEHLPNINRFEPMPQQDLFLQSQKKNRILFGGNRAGKTTGGLADDVLILLRRHPYREHLYADRPRRLRFIGVDFERGIDQTAVPLFAQYIPPSKLINGAWEDSYRQSEHMLTLADKSTVSFMSYEQHPNKFQSVSLDHVHFDEEPPKAIWRETMLRLIDTDGTWTLSETPVMQLEWVFDEYIEPYEDGDPDVRKNLQVFYLNSLDNVHLPAETLADLMKGMSEDELNIRIRGGYNRTGSIVFPEFSRKYPNVIEHDPFVERFRADREHWRVYSHMDHGYANPTAWIWTAVHEDGSIVTIDVQYAKGVVVAEWAKRWHQNNQLLGLEYFNDARFSPYGTFGDPAINQKNAESGLSVQQLYALAGVNIGTEGIVKARTGNQNVGLDKMHTYLRPRPVAAGPSAATGEEGEPWWQMLDTTTTALQDEVRKARKPKQTAIQAEIKNQSEEIRDKDNHAIDASKYLFMITHDLRPSEFRDSDQRMLDAVAGDFRPATTAFTTHDQVFAEDMYPASNGWSTTESDSYSRLEY